MSPQTGHVTLHPVLGSLRDSGKGGGCTGQRVHGVGGAWGHGCTGRWVHGAVVSRAAGQGTAGANAVGFSRAHHLKTGHGVAQDLNRRGAGGSDGTPGRFCHRQEAGARR